MRWSLPVILAGFILLALLLPAVASASNAWDVKTPTGRYAGTAIQDSSGPAGAGTVVVAAAISITFGYVRFQDAHWAIISRDNAKIVGVIRRAGKYVWIAGINSKTPTPQTATWRARRAKHVWRLQERVHGVWRTKGWVRRTCPGPLATGAAHLLL